MAFIENPRSVYILTRKEYSGGVQFEYQHLYIDIIYSVTDPERIEWHYGCFTSKENWIMSTNEHRQFIGKRIIEKEYHEHDYIRTPCSGTKGHYYRLKR